MPSQTKAPLAGGASNGLGAAAKQTPSSSVHYQRAHDEERAFVTSRSGQDDPTPPWVVRKIVDGRVVFNRSIR